jgi:hypothetical protein
MPEGFRDRLADLQHRAPDTGDYPRSRSREWGARERQSRDRDRERDRERRDRGRSRERERRRSRSRSDSREVGRGRRRSRSPQEHERGARAGGCSSAAADLRAQAVEFAQAPGRGAGAARMLGAAVGATQGDGGEWYYMDARGVQQGPFGLQQMRQWYAAGYFAPELQAKRGRRGELRRFATISEIAVADEMQLRLELATAGGGDRDGARASAVVATAMPSVEESSAQIAAMQRESLAASVQQPGAGKEEGRGAGGRHPTFGSAPWRAEQERRDVFQQHQAVVIQRVRPTAVSSSCARLVDLAGISLCACACSGHGTERTRRQLLQAKQKMASALAASASSGERGARPHAPAQARLVPPGGELAKQKAKTTTTKKKTKTPGSFLGSLKSQLAKATTDKDQHRLKASEVAADDTRTQPAFTPVHYQR